MSLCLETRHLPQTLAQQQHLIRYANNLQYLHPTRIQMTPKGKLFDPLPPSHILHSEAPTHS